MAYLDIVTAQLEIDEERRPLPYDDATGKTFVKGDKLIGNLTQGVGTNLSAGLDDTEINFLRDRRINKAAVDAAADFNFDETISDARKAALVNLRFNLGERTLEQFTTFISLVLARDWSAAADDLLATAYAKEVGLRAARLSDKLRNG